MYPYQTQNAAFCSFCPFPFCSVKFSPFYENRLAIATTQNFSFLGNGRLHVLDLSPDPSLLVSQLVYYDTVDNIYDVTWFESHDSIVIAAIADGSVKLYDLALPQPQTLSAPSTNTLARFTPPTTTPSAMTPSSWNDTVKLWTLDRPTSEHAYRVYSSDWNPHHADVFASASGDCTVQIWDVREPGSTMILACDWNKYDDCVIATASVDKSLKMCDVRNFRVPVAMLNGHGYAVRKVKFSLHVRNLLVSCSYGMMVCVWDFTVEDALVSMYDYHTKFAIGVDMGVLVEGLMASIGWDELD